MTGKNEQALAAAKAIYRQGRSKIVSTRRTVVAPLHRVTGEWSLRRFPTPRMLHVGCGRVHFDGWVNIDSARGAAVDARWDLRRGVPGEDASASFIYCEHFLEHLTVQDGLAFLESCRRVLAPGGVLRVAMPSLDFLLERATSPQWADQDWLRWPEYRFIKTRAEMLNIAFRSWGHQYLYDREEFHRRLHEVGLSNVRDVEPNQSEHAALRGRETRPDSILICEASRER